MWEGGGRLTGNKALPTARCCYLHAGKDGLSLGFGSSPSWLLGLPGRRYRGLITVETLVTGNKERSKETLVLRIGPLLTSFTPGGQHTRTTALAPRVAHT